MNRMKKNGRSIIWLKILRNALFAVLGSMLLIVAAAFMLQQQLIVIDSISVINPIIKVLAAFFSGFMSVKLTEKRSWLYGAAGGMIYMALSYVLFSILSGEFNFGTGLLIDIAMCGFAGLMAGVIHQMRK